MVGGYWSNWLQLIAVQKQLSGRSGKNMVSAVTVNRLRLLKLNSVLRVMSTHSQWEALLFCACPGARALFIANVGESYLHKL